MEITVPHIKGRQMNKIARRKAITQKYSAEACYLSANRQLETQKSPSGMESEKSRVI